MNRYFFLGVFVFALIVVTVIQLNKQVTTARLAEQSILTELIECKTSARFGITDSGVIYSKTFIDGELLRAWTRTDHKSTYWQTSDGRWGIVDRGPVLPWFRRIEARKEK